MGKSTNAAPKKGKARRDWKTPFLEALASDGSVKTACLAASINRSTAYTAYGKDQEFAKAWDSAVIEAVDSMEAEAYRRAVKGCEKPVFHRGVECGRIREYSDTLLIFLIKAGKPEKYREPKGETSITINDERNTADPAAAKRALEAANEKPRLRIEP